MNEGHTVDESLVDVERLVRASKYLSICFWGIWIVYGATFALSPELLDMSNYVGALIYLTLFILGWGYLIMLGMMVRMTGRSLITWIGGTLVFNIFGLIVSYGLMIELVRKLRN